MSGMSTGLNADNPMIVSAFHAALLHQGLVVFLILAVMGLAWNVLRSAQLRTAADGEANLLTVSSPFSDPEPAARRLLRVAFGLIWIFDGILQAQASMPLGMAPQVIQPAAADLADLGAAPRSTPGRRSGATTRSPRRPRRYGSRSASVCWLLVARGGTGHGSAGLASVGWGLVVWVFGEAFGGIFAPGLTWLFGAPGAVLFYCVAGVLIAAPRAALVDSPRLGRIDPAGDGPLLRRHGRPPGVARPGLLAGPADPHATPGTLTGDGPADGADSPAGRPLLLGFELRRASTPPTVGRSTSSS